MLTKGAIGNLVNRYRAVLKKCNLINTFGSLAVASMLVLGGAGMAGAAITLNGSDLATPVPVNTGFKNATITGTGSETLELVYENTPQAPITGNTTISKLDTMIVSGTSSINAGATWYNHNALFACQGNKLDIDIKNLIIGSATGESSTIFQTGIQAWGDVEIDLTGDLIINMASGNAIYAQTYGNPPAPKIDINAKNITLKASTGPGIWMQNDGDATILLEATDNITIDATRSVASILGYKNGTNLISIKAGGDILMSTSTDTYYSVNIEQTAGPTDDKVAKSTISIVSENGSLSIEGTTSAVRIESPNGGDASVELSAKKNVALSSTTGPVMQSKGGTINVTAGEALSLSSTGAPAIYASNSAVTLTAPTTTVTATGMAVETTAASTLTVNGGLDVTASGSDVVRGLRAIGGSTMNIGDASSDVTISVTGDADAYDVVAVQAKETGTAVNIKAKNFTVNVDAANADGIAYGILAQNATATGENNGAQLNIEAENIDVTVAGDTGSAIVAMSEGVLNLKGNVKASAKNVILARGNASAEVNIGAEGKTTQLDGDINFNWASNSRTPVDADVNVVLDGAESKWDGSALVSWNDMSADEKAVESNLAVTGLNVTLSNGAVWTPTVIDTFEEAKTDDNNKTTYSGQRPLAVNQLNLNGGTIAIDSGVDAAVEEITGSGGEVRMVNSDDLGSLTADKAKKDVVLQVSSIDPKTGAIQTADEVTPEKLAEMVAAVNADEATVTAYAPEGDVEGGTEVTPEQPGEEGGEVTPEQPGVEGGEVIVHRNTLMDSALQIASVNTVALDKILTNDVRKRLGDIRSDKNTTGVWMRWDGGKLKGDAGVTNDFNTVQIGGDTKVGKNCRVGVAGSFTHGDSEFARGFAELEGFSFATYATWMGENGMFADVVARLGHFSNEMKVEGRTGDIDSRVASLSGEYGWRFDLCEQFFIEPQVELAYTYVSSDDLQLGTAKYSFDSVNSLTGRAGAVFGWKLPNERGNLYARASVVQQFLGDAKISGTNGEAFNVQELDGNDTWLEYGIGANVKLTDKTYLWADIERTEGSSIEEEWRGTVGVRFSF